MKRKRLIIFGSAALALSAACGVGVYAQTLAGTSAAVGAGATLGAAGGAGLLTPSQYAAPATSAGAQRGGIMDDTVGAAPDAAQGATGTAAQTRTAPKPIRWSNETGSDMLRQLTKTPTKKPSASVTRRSSASARRIGRMTKAQRTKAVNSKYKKPAVGYLSWYLPEDRYKVTSKVWQFVSTPNDKYYYRPWAPAMKLRNPARVIGFYSWQDAMIAGYRPDPVTKPEPGAQLAHLASLTSGPNLSTYTEYIYAGQVTPTSFDASYKYAKYVADLAVSKSHTRHLAGSTVEQVLGGVLGYNRMPTYVGQPTSELMASQQQAQPGGSSTTDERLRQFAKDRAQDAYFEATR